jgi:hypothetical protein
MITNEQPSTHRNDSRQGTIKFNKSMEKIQPKTTKVTDIITQINSYQSLLQKGSSKSRERKDNVLSQERLMNVKKTVETYKKYLSTH